MPSAMERTTTTEFSSAANCRGVMAAIRLGEVERKILQEARSQGKKYPEIELFQDLPGIGFVHAATISAIRMTSLYCHPEQHEGSRFWWV